MAQKDFVTFQYISKDNKHENPPKMCGLLGNHF